MLVEENIVSLSVRWVVLVHTCYTNIEESLFKSEYIEDVETTVYV